MTGITPSNVSNSESCDVRRYLALIEAHSHRDPHTDEWSIDGIEYAGNHADARQLSVG